MFCRYCGSELDADAAFCTECGKSICNIESAITGEQAPVYYAESIPTREQEPVPVRKSGKKRLLLIIAAAVIITAVLGIVFLSTGNQKRLQAQLDLGAKYIDELEYEQALACYMSAVEIDPMCVDAYLGIVEVYIRTGEYDLALEWAEKGYDKTGDETLKEKADMIKSGNISRWDGKAVRITRIGENGNISWWHEYTYDIEGRQDSVSHYGADGKLIKTLPLTYNDDGERIDTYGYETIEGRLIKEVNHYENGLRVSLVSYAEDDVTINSWETFEYNEKGQEIKSIRGYGKNIGSKDEIAEYTESEYDKNGKEIKCIGYDSNHELMYYQTWEYNKKGKLTKYSGYNAQDVLEWYRLYEYNEDGKRISEKKYDGNGNLLFEDTYK